MKVVSETIHSEVVGILERAQRQVVLVSPYLEPWDRVITELQRAHARGVAIILISRGGEDRAKRESQLNALRPLLRYSGLVERLHAKVYLNDNEALVVR